METTTKSTGLPHWVFVLFVLVVFLFLCISFFHGRKDRREEKKAERAQRELVEKANPSSNSQIKRDLVWVIERKIEVSFTPEYGQAKFLPSGRRFSLEDSTHPYCVKNANGMEYCGGVGEDLSPKFVGEGIANMKLFFKSDNCGCDGKITIAIWIKK